MKRFTAAAVVAYISGFALIISAQSTSGGRNPHDGQGIFRFDTFGDEQLWTDVLRMHEVLPSVPPTTALAVGLKVDADALPPPVVSALVAGQLDLNDPKVTLRLLELDAVVGVVGKVAGGTFRQEFSQWGPGRYDARHHIFDGTNLRVLHPPAPSGRATLPVVIPPAFGLQGVGLETYTGDGPISYWNAYVGVTQMGGQGKFGDPRIGVAVDQKPDRVTRLLPALLAYQLSLPAPPPPPGSFDTAAAARGELLFNGAAGCAACHIPPTYTDVLRPDRTVPFLHTPAEIGGDPEYVARSATGLYRTTPLRGAWQHPPYFHDGRAADFLAVVNYYDSFFSLGLSDEEKADLVEFLKSL